MKKIRWGILSTARIGWHRVIPAMQASSNGEVFAIASRELGNAETVARKMGIPHAYGSYEALLADPEVDAIYNPLPNHLHAPWSIRCAEAGKPVLCEKPFALNAAEAQAMVEAFESGGLNLAEAFMYRFHPLTKKVVQLVQTGEIGQVRLFRSTFSFNLPDNNNIRFSKEKGGGAMLDIGCYCLNIMRDVLGEEPTRVSASAYFGAETGVDEWLSAMLAFPSGALGHFGCSFRSGHDCSYEIFGEKGRILVDKGVLLNKDHQGTIRIWRGDAHEVLEFGKLDPYQLMVEDFAASLLEQRPPRFNARDAVRYMQVVDAILADARRGVSM